jgi:PAS domain S-box-containing protein
MIEVGSALDTIVTLPDTASAAGPTIDQPPYWKLERALDNVAPEEIFVHKLGGKAYFGIFSGPITIMLNGRSETFHIYYARALTSGLLAEIGDQIGADVNIYNQGELIASSHEGLLSGGFISPMMNGDAFVRVSLMDVDQTLIRERAGRYRYEVAYLPVRTTRLAENAALGVPLLFQPESYNVEVQKATSVVLSIFALLSAATIGLGLLLARGIFEPLKALLEGTKRISRGDLAFKLPSKGRDEIGTVVEAFNEMTDRLSESQTALEERRRYLEVILTNIGTGVISTDADNRIRAMNNAAERILGVRRSQVIGKSGGEIAAADVVSKFFKLIAGGTPPDEPFVSSEIELMMEGHARTVKYMQTRLDTEGRYLGTVFVFEDLTELINSNKLAAWVEMARQIAHEIKNPLTPIKISAQFMRRAHEEKSPEFDRIFNEGAETIIQQVEVLRRIASEFSSFGRLQQLNVKPRNIVPDIHNIVKPYERNTSGVEVSLRCEAPRLDAFVDPEALRKICTNLIENAIEAMPNGGQLRVWCGETSDGTARQVKVMFRDTGPGLSGDVQQKLFEPYFSTKTTGTGLGLAICRSLSHEMGGEVDVRNLEDGEGVEAILLLRHA